MVDLIRHHKWLDDLHYSYCKCYCIFSDNAEKKSKTVLKFVCFLIDYYDVTFLSH